MSTFSIDQQLARFDQNVHFDPEDNSRITEYSIPHRNIDITPPRSILASQLKTSNYMDGLNDYDNTSQSHIYAKTITRNSSEGQSLFLQEAIPILFDQLETNQHSRRLIDELKNNASLLDYRSRANSQDFISKDQENSIRKPANNFNLTSPRIYNQIDNYQVGDRIIRPELKDTKAQEVIRIVEIGRAHV